MNASTESPATDLTRVYRGRTVDELIPKIEAELGSDAVVVRREKGLTGGVAGFFQRPFVEIEARPGTPRVDRYDEDGGAPALPNALAGTQAAAPDAVPALPNALAGTQAAAPDAVPALPAAPNAGPTLLAASDATPTVSATPDATPAPLAAPEATPLAKAPAAFTDQIAAEFEELTPASFIAAAGEAATRVPDPFAAALAQAEAALPAPTVTAAAAPAQAPVVETRVQPQALVQPQAPTQTLVQPQAPAAAAPTLATPALATATTTFATPAPAPATPTLVTPAPAPATPALATPAPAPATPALATPAPAPATPAPATPAPVLFPSSLPRGRARAKIEERLLGCGMGEAVVRELIETAAAHTLPLMPARTSLASAVQRTLAQRIPAVAPLPVGGATVALVGPGGSGKTTCGRALVQVYESRSTVTALCAQVAAGEERDEPCVLLDTDAEPAPVAAPQTAQMLRAAREQGLLVLDLPSISPADRGAIRAQAALLETIKPDRTVLALPATLGARAATQLLEALSPLAVDALAITHADETDQLGVAVETACAFGLAPAYLLSGAGASGGTASTGGTRGGLTQIDPVELAERLLG